jgi:hypothetical protein
MAHSPACGPVVADVDGDGTLEMAAVSPDLAYLWPPTAVSPAFAGAHAAWPQGGFDAAGQNAAPSSTATPVTGSGLLPARSAYCYPNPVGGEEMAHLRYVLTGEASVELLVLDAVGARVQRLRRGPQARGEQEISWSTTGYANGLYLCRLQARGTDGAAGEVVVRMAVAR